MRCIRRKEKHIPFVNDDVFELVIGWVDDFEEHGAPVLVEPFGGCVDVVVGAGVGTAYYLFVHFCQLWLMIHCEKVSAHHDCDIVVVNAVIVNRWFEKVGVFLQPTWALVSA